MSNLLGRWKHVQSGDIVRVKKVANGTVEFISPRGVRWTMSVDDFTDGRFERA